MNETRADIPARVAGFVDQGGKGGTVLGGHRGKKGAHRRGGVGPESGGGGKRERKRQDEKQQWSKHPDPRALAGHRRPILPL